MYNVFFAPAALDKFSGKGYNPPQAEASAQEL